MDADPDQRKVAIDRELRFAYLIHDVSRMRRTLFDRWLSPLGITRSQWWVLAFLSRRDGVPQFELARELDVGKVALGALIDRLEASDFVSRQPDASDRRVKRVFLTPRSRGLLETIWTANRDFNARVLDGIPEQDARTAISALDRLKRNLVAGMDESADATGA